MNGNAERDPHEPRLRGVTIYLDLNRNGELDDDEPQTVTMRGNNSGDFNMRGMYWFTGLEPGVYVVREVVPHRFLQTFPSSGAGGAHEVEVGPGQIVKGVNFGNQPPRFPRGDMDWDHGTDFDDVDDFVLGLRAPDEYFSLHGLPAEIKGDFDNDGDYDFDDIPGFVEILTSGSLSAELNNIALPINSGAINESSSGVSATLAIDAADDGDIDFDDIAPLVNSVFDDSHLGQPEAESASLLAALLGEDASQTPAEEVSELELDAVLAGEEDWRLDLGKM